MNLFKAWASRKAPEPFNPPPVEKERNYVPSGHPLNLLPPGLPENYPEEWDLNTPFKKIDKNTLRAQGITIGDIPDGLLNSYLNEQRQRWLHLEYRRHMLLHQKELDAGKERLEKLRDKYEADKVAARDFDPRPTVVQYPAGVFISYGEHEFPQKYIESITIIRRGSEPELSANEPRLRSLGSGGSISEGYVSVYEQNAAITVTLGSGRQFWYFCSPWMVDKLHDALTHAWKHGTP